MSIFGARIKTPRLPDLRLEMIGKPDKSQLKDELMARLLGVFPPGIPQHVIQRGDNQQACFAAEEDFAAYARWLYGAAARVNLSRVRSMAVARKQAGHAVEEQTVHPAYTPPMTRTAETTLSRLLSVSVSWLARRVPTTRHSITALQSAVSSSGTVVAPTESLQRYARAVGAVRPRPRSARGYRIANLGGADWQFRESRRLRPV